MSSRATLVHRPDLDDFLFAAIGEERNGMLLTVASALGRLGLDPWTEADRFSEMPKTVAAQTLAPMIARLPEGLWAAAEVQVIATRLVKLLPEHQAAATRGPAGAGARKPVSTATWLLFAVLLTAVLVSMVAGRDLTLTRSFEPSPTTSSGTDQPPPVDR